MTYDEYWRIPANVELKRLGNTGFTGERPSILWFDLAITDFYGQWKGKLVVDWPPPERSWWRWADRNAVPVHAILEEDSALDARMPSWDEIVLNWDELGILPIRWKSAISQWRGLQRVSPDMPADDVIRLEVTWKERLRTRHPFGLNDN